MRCPACRRHALAFFEWCSFALRRGFRLRRGTACTHCAAELRGSGLTPLALFAMCLTCVVIDFLALGTLLPPPRDAGDRAPHHDLLSYLLLCVCLLGSLAPVYFVAWLFGRYELDEEESEPGEGATPTLVRISTSYSAPTTAGKRNYQARDIIGPSTYYLIRCNGEARGEPIKITTDVFLAGSADECRLLDESLPAHQCLFLTTRREIRLRDLNSGQPTRVNGEVMVPGSHCVLQVGDHIEFGPFAFMLQFRQTPLSQRELHAWALECLDASDSHLFADEDVFRAQKTMASVAAQDIIDQLRSKRRSTDERLQIEQNGDVTVARIQARDVVDEFEIEMLRKDLCRSFERPGLRVVLNLRGVYRISDAGVSMLVDVCRRIRHQGSRVAVCRIRTEVLSVLEQFRALQIPYYHDTKAAVGDHRW